jgi:hypothetical protein
VHIGDAATGFIRFMQGYYMLLISRKSKVGAIGSHFVYSIDDTIYVPIPHPSFKPTNNPNEEMRYCSRSNKRSMLVFGRTTHGM